MCIIIMNFQCYRSHVEIVPAETNMRKPFIVCYGFIQVIRFFVLYEKSHEICWFTEQSVRLYSHV